MSFRLNRKVFISILAGILISLAHIKGQTYRFRNYGPDSNIPNGFVYTIVQDNNGYLWVGTGTGLSKFDGFEFFNVSFPDSVTNRYATCSLKDRNGTIWFGCNDGSVFYTEEGSLKQLGISNSKTISDIAEGPDGMIYIVPQSTPIFRVNPLRTNRIESFEIDRDLILFSLCFTGSGDLLTGTQEDVKIFRIEDDTLKVTASVEGFDYASVMAVHRLKGKDKFLIGTNGNGLFRLDIENGARKLFRLDDHQGTEYMSIQSIFEDSEGDLWISTNESGIIQVRFSDDGETVQTLKVFDKTSGLAGNNIRRVFQDMEGNYWIGHFGDGLSLLNSYAFSFHVPGKIPEANNIIYVTRIAGDYFLGTPSGYYLFEPGSSSVRSFSDLAGRTGGIEISSYHVDDENNVWFGTRGGGLYVKRPSGTITRYYRSGDSGEDYITDIEIDKRYIWIGSLNGVVILNKSTGAFKGRYNINNGLPHNSINKLLITREGKVAVATKADRIYFIDPDEGVSSGSLLMYGTTMNDINSFCQSNDGNLWAATAGNGTFEFSSDSVQSFTRNEMLMSDYCYSILSGSEEEIWIGHERGFSRYNRTTGIMRTYGTDFASGGVCNADGMYESNDGKVLIGTTQGLIVYDRLRDRKTHTPPFNNINSITINDIAYPYRQSFTLPYSKRYTITVDYVGINFSDPEKVYYQTRLDNWDNEWSRITREREVIYSPRDGRYKFNLISVNQDGLSQDEPVSFELVIKKPFWRTWWFIVSSVLAVSGIVIIIIREREKAQKKIQLYLETELDARTKVVIQQKTEIELQNIEITDSITYAKRIQTSILPDFIKVKETFRDAFLLFRPRDIVSGDFYWFDKLDNDRFILVCADSTGHGVPGAFMSMIGSTLLQDIVTRQQISKPSQVLTMLDKQVFSTLNQNLELGVSNDGMDVVVCVFNIKERHLVFSSAMRPVIIVMNGEPVYIKGNRASVGGESAMEKFFDDQEYYLSEGDIVYMFSDGLPDQFGGTDGKKMKIARLKKIIEDVVNLPMESQKEVIMKFYDEWKGEYEQVDDVLLIGVRL